MYSMNMRILCYTEMGKQTGNHEGRSKGSSDKQQAYPSQLVAEVNGDIEADHRLILDSESTDLDVERSYVDTLSMRVIKRLDMRTLRDLLRKFDGVNDRMLTLLNGAINIGMCFTSGAKISIKPSGIVIIRTLHRRGQTPSEEGECDRL